MASERGSEQQEDELSEDAVLGGALRLRQPRRGHRVGHDAILLSASCPLRAGDRVVELGAGVGAVGLALAVRGGVTVTLVEIDARLAALAVENARCNGLAASVASVVLDVAAPASAFSAAGLAPGTATRVVMNPPFNDPERQRSSPDRGRRFAHAGSAGTLVTWVRTAGRLLQPHGTLTMIWRADGLAEVLNALAAAFGGVTLLPVHSRPGGSAIRILVRATSASRAPLVLLPGFILQDGSGRPSAEAEAVLRGDALLPLAQA